MDGLKRQQRTGGELLVCALLELIIVNIAYRIDRRKTAPLLSTAAWAIVLGVGFGLVLSSISKTRATDIGLDPQILFFGLLPPIILESGFNTQRGGILSNLWSILLLVIVGTLITTAAGLIWFGQTPVLAAAFTPSEAMLYGSLISAIDPIATQLVLRRSHVPPLLPELIFSERSLNNAIAIAIFNLCEMRVQNGDTETSVANALSLLGVGVGSLVLAALVGYSSAYLLRQSDEQLRQHQAYEISILLLFAYANYLAGEFLQLFTMLTRPLLHGLRLAHKCDLRTRLRDDGTQAPALTRVITEAALDAAAMVETTDVEKRWTGAELLVCAVIQLLLVNVAYRIDRQKRAPLISTSAWAISFGLVCGGVLSVVSQTRVHSAGLDPDVLFFGLLPPIIFEAGFNTQRKGFFTNFFAILLLAVVGTLIATFVTGGILIWLGSIGLITQLTAAEAFLFGSLISAIDPVATLLVFKKTKAPSLLLNLVFGESVLNDAVAIVVFGLFQTFVASGNTDVTATAATQMVLSFVCIGVGSVLLAGAICLASAFFLRHSDATLKEYPTYEISVLLLSSYASYVTAELCALSGLLAVFFSGVFIRHYHMYNISSDSAHAFKHLLATLAFLAENFIYLYLGISVFAFRDSLRWDWRFIAATFAACLIARALNTFPLCSLANAGRSARRQIPVAYMVVIWFSGLRGAIAFALVLNVQTAANPEHAAMLKSATLFIVLFTTVFFGMATSPLLAWLKLTNVNDGDGVDVNVDENHVLLSSQSDAVATDTAIVETPPGSRNAHDVWVHLDETYLKPMFGGNPRFQQPSKSLAEAVDSGAGGTAFSGYESLE